MGNLIYLYPPLNNQENTNETKLKLNGSYLNPSLTNQEIRMKVNESK
jgi:hypothetical protein